MAEEQRLDSEGLAQNPYTRKESGTDVAAAEIHREADMLSSYPRRRIAERES